MTETSLGPVGYIVLGMLAQCGPGTSYDLKRWVDESVGFFWTFPRSQLYAEPQRLAALGYVSETQEQTGRRRRVFAISAAGREVLTAWLDTPAGVPELRDPGLLRLFFSAQGQPDVAARIAVEQVRGHRERLQRYEQMMQAEPESTAELHMPHLPMSQTLQMGLLYERACVAFWENVLSEEQASQRNPSVREEG